MKLTTLLAAAGTAAGTAGAVAQVFTYQGPGGTATSPTTGVWSAGGNFAGGVAPTSGPDWTMSITHTSSAVTGGTGFETENDIANNFVLSALSLNNTISNSNVVKGRSLRFSEFTNPAAPASISLAGTRDFKLDLNMDATGRLNINQNGGAHLWIKQQLSIAGVTTVAGTGAGWVNFGTNGSGADHLTGAGSLVKDSATTRLGMAGQNTYSGGTTLNAGRLQLDSSSTLAAGSLVSGPLGTGPLAINGGRIVTNRPVLLHNTTTINGTAEFGSNLGDGALAKMTFARPVTLSAAATTITVHNYSEVLVGAGFTQTAAMPESLTKEGFGRLYLNGASSIRGAVTVNAGGLDVGWAPQRATAAERAAAKAATLGTAAAPLSSLTAARGASINGRGTIWVDKTVQRGEVRLAAGGTIKPGNSPGVLTIDGHVRMEPGSIFEVSLNGPEAGDEDDNHGQLRLKGEIMLTGAILQPELNYIPNQDDVLYIINNVNPEDLTIGQFSQGSVLYLTSSVDGLSYPFGISYEANADYQGSDLYGKITGGNDVALYSLIPTPGSLALLGLGLLVGARRRRG